MNFNDHYSKFAAVSYYRSIHIVPVFYEHYRASHGYMLLSHTPSIGYCFSVVNSNCMQIAHISETNSYFRDEAGKAYVRAATEHGRAMAELEVARLQYERISIQPKRYWREGKCGNYKVTARTTEAFEAQNRAEKIMKQKESQLECTEGALREKKITLKALHVITDSSSQDSD